jgi:hypothetical protein
MSRWNYALDLRAEMQHEGIGVRETTITDKPFALDGTSTQLQVKAKLWPSWTSFEGVAETLAEGPVQSTELEEMITLIPYAAAKLRITSFPRLKAKPLLSLEANPTTGGA